METRDKITNHFLPHLWGKWSGRTEGGSLSSTTPLPRFAVLSPQGGQWARSGFTLIELLVVVLIIGILAAIALPQYQKAVEKSRVAEVLQNAKVIEECFDWYILEHGLPSSGSVELEDMNCPMEINLGNLDEEEGGYKTDNFWYEFVNCNKNLGCMADIRRFPSNFYSFEIISKPSRKGKVCFTQFTDKGRFICNSLRNQGWEYEEGEL